MFTKDAPPKGVHNLREYVSVDPSAVHCDLAARLRCIGYVHVLSTSMSCTAEPLAALEHSAEFSTARTIFLRPTGRIASSAIEGSGEEARA